MTDHADKRPKHKDAYVTDDWPDELPVTEAEIDLLAEHLLDIVTAMIQHH